MTATAVEPVVPASPNLGKGLFESSRRTNTAISLHALTEPADGERPVDPEYESRYTNIQPYRTGSFSEVFRAKINSGEDVILKRVKHDRRFKSRELELTKKFSEHLNVISLQDDYFIMKGGELYLTLVFPFVPDTLQSIVDRHHKAGTSIPHFLVKLYAYQMCRALAFIHAAGAGHRDLKPSNVLIDESTGHLRLCDFGNAKMFAPGEVSVSYITCRYYRAPELILGATMYTPAIDIWSLGCLTAEMLLSRPVFAGASPVEQLVTIVRALGSPTDAEFQAMNPHIPPFRFPHVKPPVFSSLFPGAPDDLIDLVAAFLQYTPSKRLVPADALRRAVFSEILAVGATLPSGAPLPPLRSLDESDVSDS